MGSTRFQITYDGQTTNVLALVTTALSNEIVLSWRALQRLKVLPEDFPRAQTTVKANQVQSTKKEAIKAKDASEDDTVDLQESMEILTYIFYTSFLKCHFRRQAKCHNIREDPITSLFGVLNIYNFDSW